MSSFQIHVNLEIVTNGEIELNFLSHKNKSEKNCGERKKERFLVVFYLACVCIEDKFSKYIDIDMRQSYMRGISR